jgi:hypothetical protein
MATSTFDNVHDWGEAQGQAHGVVQALQVKGA